MMSEINTTTETKTNQSEKALSEVEYIKSHFRCDNETGKVFSLTRPTTRGNISPLGYLRFGTIPFHRIIWILNHGEIPEGFVIDHKSGQKLDNRLDNLRLATVSQNRANSKPTKREFKGVYPLGENRYFAQIVKGETVKYLGTYSNPIDAARAYNEAAKILHGEFARLNNIEGEYR